MVEGIVRFLASVGLLVTLLHHPTCNAFKLVEGLFSPRPEVIQDDIIIALNTDSGFEGRIAAGRAARLVRPDIFCLS